MASKKAFITGISGQDGSYLTEFLLDKGYEVAGLVRRSATGDLGNVEAVKEQIKIYYGDLQSPESIALALLDFKPDEIYNLASLSSPFASFSDKLGSIMITGVGALHVFERAKEVVRESWEGCGRGNRRLYTLGRLCRRENRSAASSSCCR